MSATATRPRAAGKRKQATPNADGYVPTIWRCETSRNLTLRLPAPLDRDIQFRQFNYRCESKEIEEMLKSDALKRKRQKHRIHQYTGVSVHACPLCPFMAVEAEQLRWHVEAEHDINSLRAAAERGTIVGLEEE